MNCRCKTITRKQQDFLGRLAEIGIEACLGGKNSLSYRILFYSCCENLDSDFEKVFGTTELSELKACRYNDAVEFIAEWFPDDVLMELSVQMEKDFEKFRYRYVEEMPQGCPAYQQLMEDFINAICSGTERPYED